MRIPNSMLIPEIARLVREGKTVTLPLTGFSMRPYLENARDKALLAVPPDELRVGDVVLAELPDKRYAMHRIVKIEEDDITMYGDGNFSPEYIGRSDVLAIALGFYRKGRTELEGVNGCWYQCYWRIWVALRPVRRVLLMLWRLKHYPKETVKGLVAKVCNRG